jgi:hypothetical protein
VRFHFRKFFPLLLLSLFVSHAHAQSVPVCDFSNWSMTGSFCVVSDSSNSSILPTSDSGTNSDTSLNWIIPVDSDSNWNVSPVPEPEIYAMMGVGLGLMGWVARRKKSKESATT